MAAAPASPGRRLEMDFSSLQHLLDELHSQQAHREAGLRVVLRGLEHHGQQLTRATSSSIELNNESLKRSFSCEVAPVHAKQLAGLLRHRLQLRTQALPCDVPVVGHVEAMIRAQGFQLIDKPRGGREAARHVQDVCRQVGVEEQAMRLVGVCLKVIVLASAHLQIQRALRFGISTRIHKQGRKAVVDMFAVRNC
eukprot:3239715-Pleurochrysis_carterae.AAC.1